MSEFPRDDFNYSVPVVIDPEASYAFDLAAGLQDELNENPFTSEERKEEMLTLLSDAWRGFVDQPARVTGRITTPIYDLIEEDDDSGGTARVSVMARSSDDVRPDSKEQDVEDAVLISQGFTILDQPVY
jgi:hypothetical protein